MVEGTLPSWVTVIMVGIVSVGLFGYFNHYVPKEQQKKAERIMHDSYRGSDFFVRYSTRLSQIWYLVCATVFSVITLICFIFQDFDLLCMETRSFGLMGGLINALALIVMFFVTDLALTIVACAGETAAINDTKRHYWRRYGAIMISDDESF